MTEPDTTAHDSDRSRAAAEMLTGLELPHGWRVVERLERSSESTGGNFSVGYIVERGDHRAFLKALDYSFAFDSGNAAQVLEWMTSAFNFEIRVLERCAARRMDRVVQALDSGEIVVAEADGVGTVSYLIFELAEGDIRRAMDSLGPAFDYAWAFRMGHHTATALWQMHGSGLAHQDVKPSNVLTFGRSSNKLGDLGRASERGSAAPHDAFDCAGDPQYAPPELLYGHLSPEWTARRQACATATAAMLSFLDEAQRPGTWTEAYEDVLPYLRVAFEQCVGDFESSLSVEVAAQLVPMVRQLCDPDPRLRGHPRTRASRTSNPYSLERYVSELNLLATRAEIGFYGEAA
jgi:serine/threonine protein kinase